MFNIGYFANNVITKAIAALQEASDDKVKAVADAAAFCFTIYLMSKPITAYVQHKIEMEKKQPKEKTLVAVYEDGHIEELATFSGDVKPTDGCCVIHKGVKYYGK